MTSSSAPPSRPPAFVLDGVSVRFGDTLALEDIHLEVAAGERVGFVGPSGAGKTTLLRLLGATLRPDRGTVWIDGRDVSRCPETELRQLRSRLGVVHQDLRLIPNVRVLRNVLAGRLGRRSLLGGLRLLFWPPRGEVQAVYTLLERVGIGDKLFQATNHLSGGQQQRVAIARALYQGPTSLLADEPLAALDPARSRDTLNLLVDLCRESGLTLCTSLHDLDVARAYLPRLVGLRDGKIVVDRAADAWTPDDFEALYELNSARHVS